MATKKSLTNDQVKKFEKLTEKWGEVEAIVSDLTGPIVEASVKKLMRDLTARSRGKNPKPPKADKKAKAPAASGGGKKRAAEAVDSGDAQPAKKRRVAKPDDALAKKKKAPKTDAERKAPKKSKKTAELDVAVARVLEMVHAPAADPK